MESDLGPRHGYRLLCHDSNIRCFGLGDLISSKSKSYLTYRFRFANAGHCFKGFAEKGRKVLS